ncbi:MAG: SpoIIE family protein phosphatase [Gammaproteobacteria bacterium]
MAAVPKQDFGEPARAGNAQMPLALVVDDDAANRLVLRCLLERERYRVVEATDGDSALAAFDASRPDIVLLDIVMPGTDGYEVARAIKARSSGNYVPVMFLTALRGIEDITRCLEHGDDVMVKPYDPLLLGAKLQSMVRMRAMYQEAARQRDELAEQRRIVEEDIRIAQRIFSRVTRTSSLEMPNLRHLLRPLEIVAGDFILAARRPSGDQLFLLGDAAGHGLPAAVTAMAVCDVFYAMAGKGIALSEIVGEINRKLLQVMPTGRYLAAAFVELDTRTGTLAVCNAGLPDVLIYDGDVERRVPSMHLPLGIADVSEETRPVRFPVSPQSRVYVYSDGITEAFDRRGTAFGQERLEAVLRGRRQGAFDRLVTALDAFTDGAPSRDDQSLLEIRCIPPEDEGQAPAAGKGCIRVPAAPWRLSLELQANALVNADPVATMLQAVSELQGLGPLRQRLYVVLAELYSNALDHGLLGLDSSLKGSPTGFAEYYERRTAALQALDGGTVHVEFSNRPMDGGGELRLKLSHDGTGFDPASIVVPMDGNTAASGRGIGLVRALCSELRYSDDGRTVEATYLWSECSEGCDC